MRHQLFQQLSSFSLVAFPLRSRLYRIATIICRSGRKEMFMNFKSIFSGEFFGGGIKLVSVSLVAVFALFPFSAIASDCDQVNLSGKFRLSSGQYRQDGRSYAITQQNCRVTIVESG